MSTDGPTDKVRLLVVLLLVQSEDPEDLAAISSHTLHHIQRALVDFRLAQDD